jgi:Zn-dependent peptidase ImmA (M78 family)
MPKPVKFLRNDEIEEKAAQVLDDHVTGGQPNPVLPIDIDTLTECDFRFLVEWAPIDDPPGCRTFATLQPTLFSETHTAKLTLNKNYQEFLFENPQIERLTRAHELCHHILHIDEGRLKTGLLPFAEKHNQFFYHRAKWSDGFLTADQKNRLARFAMRDEKAYRVLKQREFDPQASVEPEWMRRQAEHFAACLLVPRTPLYQALEGGDDPAFYGTHVKLAEIFQVSRQVIQIRLKKLGIIEESPKGKYRSLVATDQLEFR